ncbi:MAG: TatD family hydrolase [Burkholderiales bacterium]
MLVDTHCHLDASEFDADRDAVVARARAAGVGRIVVPAVGAFDFDAVRALAVRHPEVRYALGIHPMYVDRAGDADLDRLRDAVADAIDDPAFVGIGEIGLDHFVPGLDRVRMERFYVAQLELAREFGLPVILHVRRAQDTVLKHLRRSRPAGGIAHAFNGSLQQAEAFAGLGFAMGFGGAMTFTRALQIRRLAATLPLEAIVLETDAPDIPPEWDARGRNEPAHLPRIAEVLASLRGVDAATLIAATGSSAARVLPRLGSGNGPAP